MSSLWNSVLGTLERRIPREQLQEWLEPTEVFQETKNGISLVVPNDLVISWIQENYLEEIYLVLRELGHPDFKVQFLTKEDSLKREAENLAARKARADNGEQQRLNAKYHFENFVVGNSNQFAHAAALAVAEAPSSTYNPLFLYGQSGLGKTHLLQAIGHYLLRRGDLKICYTTCEEFTNHFINSIRFNKGEAFRQCYRSVDVLLIDDIQFLSGKAQTQEEFFHTFNSLFEAQKQIILSSDCTPNEIPKLEARLISRFQWGLIADVQPPALETRIAILKKKSEAEGVHLGDDVILYIASKVKTNVRELEGALIKLLAYASLGNHQISLELAEQCLSHHFQEASTLVNCDKIKRFIAERYQIQSKDLCTKSNAKRIAHPRQIAMYLTRQLTSMSLPEIGHAFGNKHHSTVLYSIQKVSKQMEENAEYSSLIAGYQKSLG